MRRALILKIRLLGHVARKCKLSNKAKVARKSYRSIFLMSAFLFCFLVDAEISENSKSWFARINLMPVNYSQKSKFTFVHKNSISREANELDRRFHRITAFAGIDIGYSQNFLNYISFFDSSENRTKKVLISLEMYISDMLDIGKRTIFSVLQVPIFSSYAWTNSYIVGRDLEKLAKEEAGGILRSQRQGGYVHEIWDEFFKIKVDTKGRNQTLLLPEKFNINKSGRDLDFLGCALNANIIISGSVKILPGVSLLANVHLEITTNILAVRYFYELHIFIMRYLL